MKAAPFGTAFFMYLPLSAKLYTVRSFSDPLFKDEPNDHACRSSKDNGDNTHARELLCAGIRKVRIVIVYSRKSCVCVIP